MLKDPASLEKIIGVKFKKPELLTQSMVHRSYLNENPKFPLGHNERLEFLGDAVLEMAVTEFLYKNYDNPEGDLTNWRASLVNAKMLASLAAELGLENYLYLSRGESKDAGTKARQYILANAYEALIGAIYLDRGMKIVSNFIHRFVIVRLPLILENRTYIDSKSHFQEAAQEKLGITPTYRVLSESGPDHHKQFLVGIYLDKEQVATGEGESKQEAQTAAAEAALQAKGW